MAEQRSHDLQRGLEEGMRTAHDKLRQTEEAVRPQLEKLERAVREILEQRGGER
jgi:hypothetical protein